MSRSSSQFTALGWLIWSLAALFFFYEFFLRVFLATISTTVMEQLNLNAQTFAIVGAGYYLAYAIMQIPIGFLVDRFGVRILLTIFVVFAAIGAVWFSFSQDFFQAFFSRMFMGLGSSAAYVSLIFIALNWFPKRHMGLIIGLSGFLGAIGPVLAGGPLAYLLSHTNNDWRLILETVGLFGFLLAALVLLFVRNSPKRKKNQIIHIDPSRESTFQKLKELARIPEIWAVITYTGFVYVSLALMGAYWGTGFLQAKGIPATQAASASSMLWIGLAVGSLLCGKISDWLKRRLPVLIAAAILGIFASMLILYYPSESPFLFGAFFFLLGVASSGQSVAFTAITEKAPKKVQATAVGMNNTAIMLLGAFIPPIVSGIIAKASADSTTPTLSAFLDGLIYMPVFYGIALLMAIFFIKETYTRHQHEIIKISIKH